MVEPSDRQLWDASRRGDGDAFVTLVERYEAAVCAVTWAWTRNRVDSEELAQEAFARAWQRLGQLREPEKVGAWLCGIARNVARRHRSSPRTIDAVDRLEASGTDPESATVARQQHAVVRDALSRLPPRYREPLVLYYRQGCSSREVAEVLGVSPNVIDQRLSRGRRMLRADVERVLEDVVGPPAPRGRVRRRVAALLPGLGLPGAKSRPAMVTLALGVLTMKKAIAIAAALLLVVLVAAVVRSGDDAPDRMKEDVSSAAAIGRTSAVADGGDVAAIRNARERLQGDDASAALVAPRPDPRALQPSLRGNIYTVNLDGGPSRMIVARSKKTTLNFVGGDPDEPMAEDTAAMLDMVLDHAEPPEAVREVAGTVTDRDGQPVSGVTVLAGGLVAAHWGGEESYAEAANATVSDGSGAFSLKVDASEALSVVAIGSSGWSNVSRVPAGSAPAEVVLRLDAEAKLVGRTTRNGEAEPAHVRISTKEGMFYEVESSADGSFEVAPISPGSYVVAAYRDNGGDMARTKPGYVQVDVAEQGVTNVEVAMPAGAAVVVEYADADERATVVMAQLFEGHHETTRPGDLQQSPTIVSGAMHQIAEGVMQFSDIAPGEYTACGMLYLEMKPSSSEAHGLQFGGDVLSEGCKTLEVADGDEVVEVVVPTVARED